MTISLTLAANEADSAALEAITQRQDQLVGTVVAHSTALLDASAAGSLEGASNARRDLVLYCRGELLPHVIAEEDTLYALAQQLPETKLLIDAMIADHRTLAELIDDLAGATTPLGASAAAHALRVLYELHVEKANDYVLPAVAASPDVSLADGLDRLRTTYEELSAAAQGGGCGGGGCGCGSGGGGCGCGGHSAAPEPAGGGCGCGGGGCGCGGGHGTAVAEAPVAEAPVAEAPVAEAPVEVATGGGCACGGHDEPGRPVLDARQVPHNIRHATVFGALDAVRPGSGLELVAPHDPLPLLAQIEERNPGVFEVSYLERGPEVWRIALDRRGEQA